MEIKFSKEEIEKIVIDYTEKKYRKNFKLEQWVDHNNPTGIVISENLPPNDHEEL